MNIFKMLPKLSAEEQKKAKDHLFFAVRFWCALSEKTRREGILSLGVVFSGSDMSGGERIVLADGSRPFPRLEGTTEEYADIEDWLFKHLLGLIIDGTDVDTVLSITRYSLCNLENHLAPATMLSLLIGAQAIHDIQVGESPRYTKYHLCAMLGHELCEEFLLTQCVPLELEPSESDAPFWTPEDDEDDEE